MKPDINVIDLDKTLINDDSFRSFIKMELMKFDFRVIYLTLLRVLKLISMSYYKMKLIQYVKTKYNHSYFKEFAEKLHPNLDKEVLEKIEKESDNNTVNILLSASPNIYVKYLIQKLGWEGCGSYFNDQGEFIHLHGKNKIKWLLNNYNKKEYNYNFAISDSDSDKELLSLFKKHILWKF